MSDTEYEPGAGAGRVEDGAITADHRSAVELVEAICASSGLDVHAELRALHPPYVEIELVGSDAEPIWGRGSHYLDALQTLANAIQSRRTGSDVRLLLDAGGYRARRAEILTHRAIELAEEVKARNEEAELEPLPSHERRIVHNALLDDPDVSTYSEGDEPMRHVVISPKR